MRPFPGSGGGEGAGPGVDDAFLRSRMPDNDTTPMAFGTSGGVRSQMSYFIADEASIDASLASTAAFLPTRHHDRKSRASEVGPTDGTGSGNGGSGGLPHNSESLSPDRQVASNSNTNQQHNSPQSRRPQRDRNAAEELIPSASLADALHGLRREGRTQPGGETPLSLRTLGTFTASNPSQPMTPILLGVSGPTSVLSSVSSRRNSLSGSLEDLASQAPSAADDENAVEDEDDAQTDQESTLPSMMDSGSAPQLIMPSIKMPSRRPFTTEGKAMGRLKVVVAGASGVGKTSLIKAIVQSCEHIVHVDPIATPPTGLTASMGSIRASRSPAAKARALAEPGTRQISEIYASTKPYPDWWSEMDTVDFLRRRKSLGDTVLDRNVCFVDTPGYNANTPSLDMVTPVVQYVESHLQRMHSNTLDDSSILRLLGGDGGSQVDLVLYLISGKLKPVDIHYLQALAPLSNLVLLLARADLMPAADLAATKEQVESQVKEAGIRPFRFSPQTGPTASSVFVVSSATTSDHDTMDASLLMSPDYVQPLVSTELERLVRLVFAPDGASQLRYSAANKYVQWRNSEGSIQSHSPRPPISLNSSYSLLSGTNSQALTPSFGGSSYALARVNDHTQREERLAQIRLANWAVDLQKSMANERAQYEKLLRSDRVIWLNERLEECTEDGMLVPVTSQVGKRRSDRGVGRSRDKLRRRMDEGASSKTKAHQDPLGLLEVTADIQHKGRLALELVGSLSVLGGLALWASKHYWHFQAYEWMLGEWERLWGGSQ